MVYVIFFWVTQNNGGRAGMSVTLAQIPLRRETHRHTQRKLERRGEREREREIRKHC